jgi:sugar fermentation stimulation protein A
MRFSTPLVPARLIRRYKRFLADCRLDTGDEITAHCANPGSMLGLAVPGQRIWLEPNNDPRKKLRYGWRLVDHENGHFTGVDTSLPNRALKAALTAHQVAGLPDYDSVQSEVSCGDASRIDFLLTGPKGRTWVEVKSVTLSRQPGRAEFPDSVTQRGAKHLHDLARMVGQGDQALMIYLVQRTDCDHFALAADLDPGYAAAFGAAQGAGVGAIVIDCAIDPGGVILRNSLPLVV